MTGTYLFFGFAAFCFGLIVGSFLNVCIYRMPREESLIYPPSHCPKCYQPIRPEDNIPVLSWLMLRGKCRFCGQRISIIYPAVELFTGALFAFYYWRFISPHAQTTTVFPMGRQLVHMGALYLVHMAFISALVVVTFVDFKHLIIPDEISIGGTVLALAASFIFPEMHNTSILQGHSHLASLVTSLIGAGVGAGTIYGMGAAGKALLHKEAMGMGDVKLMAMIGAFLGWELTVFVIFFSALIGTIYGGVHLAVTGHSKIPYGPFLSIAAVVSLFFHREVNDFIENLIQTYRYFLW